LERELETLILGSVPPTPSVRDRDQ
jgi:hypothetical protein